MKFIIWGYTNETMKIADNLDGMFCFADNNGQKVGLEHNGWEVFSLQKVKSMCQDKEFKVLIPDCFEEDTKLNIYIQLKFQGIEQVSFLCNGEIHDTYENIKPNNDEVDDIAIYESTGNHWVNYIQYLHAYFPNIRVKAIITSNPSRKGGKWNEIPFIQNYMVRDEIDNNKFTKVVIAPDVDLIEVSGIIKELNDDVLDYVYKVPYGFSMREKHSRKDMFIKYENRSELRELQYMIAYHCNLNCKGCSHFSPLVKEPLFATPQMVRRDMMRLKQLEIGIARISMLGGEPLLNKDLGEILRIIREYYPYAFLNIYSNGILVTKMSDELLNAIRETGTMMILTHYPISETMYENAIEFLKNKSVKWKINTGKNRQFFFKRFHIGDDTDVKMKYENCTSRRCTTMFDGKIATCYVPSTVSYFDAKFGTDYENSKDLWDVFKEDVTGNDLMKFLEKPNSICARCNSCSGIFTWEASGMKYDIKDYTVNS